MKNIYLGFFFLLLSAKLAAGDIYISTQFTYGKSFGKTASLQLLSDSYKSEIFHLFRNTNDLIFMRTGATISYRGKRFSSETGLLYSRVITDNYYWGNNKGLNMVQLPLGCNLIFGKKLYGYLGLGVYINYLYSQKEWAELQFADFQSGISGGIGMGYSFNTRLAIDTMYRAEKSLQPLYSQMEHTSAGPWGKTIWEDQYFTFGMLTLSLKVNIRHKKNECIGRH